jgi:hypothetical protein
VNVSSWTDEEGKTYIGTFNMEGGIISGNTANGYNEWGGTGGGVSVFRANFEKTGGTIYGYAAGNSNSNAAKNRGQIENENGRGHAVHAGDGDNAARFCDSTAGTGVNLSWIYNNGISEWDGDWEGGWGDSISQLPALPYELPFSYTDEHPNNPEGPSYTSHVYEIDDDWLLNGNQINEGDEYTFMFKYKSDRNFTELKVQLVDRTTAGNNWWYSLSKEEEMGFRISENTEVSGQVTLTAIASASSADPEANTLVFQAYDNDSGPPILTFTEFKFEKTK